jgi:hypothetical protein
VVTAVVAATLVAVTAAPALAANPVKPAPAQQETAMVLHSYDADVAAAHGYKIVTNPDGTQQSVPVTPEAVAEDQAIAAANQPAPGGVHANRTVVYGPCGSSFIGVTANGNDIIIGTGYSVGRPVIGRVWAVQVFGFGGLPSHTWLGGSGPKWNSAYAFFYTGGGFANVTPGSSVILDNGAVCYSGAPGESF